MNREDWPQVGEWVEIAESPASGPRRGIVMSLTLWDDGAGAYVVSLDDGGQPSCRTHCAVYYLTKTGRVATADEIKTIRDDDDRDERDIGKLIAECARLREYADVIDVLRAQHPDAVRTLRAWDTERRAKGGGDRG